MRASSSVLLTAMLALAACHGNPLAEVRKPSSHAGTPPGPEVVQGSPAPISASRAPVASAPPQPTIDKLLAPRTDTKALTGTITLDAAYIVAQGGGNIVAQGGGNVLAVRANIVAQGGGNIVAQGGGNLISQDGGGIVAQGGGNVVPNAASGIDATAGGAVKATAGGNLLPAGAQIVAQGGGNIVAQGGGNLISQDGGGFRLLADAAPALAWGTQAPAAGVLVSVVALSTHQYLQLGTNIKGAKVYTVYTNATGAYQLHIPTNVDGKLAVVACVPAPTDDRMVFGSIDGDVTEDSTQFMRFLRRVSINEASYYLSFAGKDTGTHTIKDPNQTAQNQQLLQGILDKLIKGVNNAKVNGDDQAQVARVSAAMADYLLAATDIDQAPVLGNQTAWKDVPAGTLALPTIKSIIGQLQAAADARVKGGKRLEDLPSIAAINAARTSKNLPPYKFLESSDFIEFVRQEFVTGNGEDFARMDPVLADLGFTDKTSEGLNTLESHLSACSLSIGTYMAGKLALTVDDNGNTTLLDGLVKRIQDAAAGT